MRARLDLQKDGLYLYRNCLPYAVPHLAFIGSEVSTYNNILTQGLQVRTWRVRTCVCVCVCVCAVCCVQDAALKCCVAYGAQGLLEACGNIAMALDPITARITPHRPAAHRTYRRCGWRTC